MHRRKLGPLKQKKRETDGQGLFQTEATAIPDAGLCQTGSGREGLDGGL